MAEIKAIETEYNGYKFRSRLEARWAYFFDMLDIQYQYEPEGIILSDGTRYLPDFYLPWFKCFLEIKSMDVYEDKEKRLLAEKKISDGMVNDNWPGIIVYGDPGNYVCKVFCYEYNDSSAGTYSSSSGAIFGIHPHKRFPWICCCGDTKDREFYPTAYRTSEEMHVTNECEFNAEDFMWPVVKRAMRDARQARFEYGETPTVKR